MRLTLLLVSMLALITPGLAASQADRDECSQGRDNDRRIAACTRVVQDNSEPAANRAAAYNSRGAAFQAKGDGERASRDFNDASALEPK